jgi:hypothetical protein
MLGKRVQFIPAFIPRDCPANAKAQKPEPVIGKIVYVNDKHSYFMAEYGWECSRQKECFKFSQIGKDVTILG